MTNTNRVQQAVNEAAERFAAELVEILRSATINELAELTLATPVVKKRGPGRPRKTAAAPAKKTAAAAPTDEKPAPKRRGRPPKKTAAAQPAEAAEAAAPKTKKKRKWQKCTVDGCDKNVYMPSGTKKMCYQHHIEAGGKESPLTAARKKKAAEKKAAKAKK